MDFTPTEKGQTIRQPSTANLMIDSLDRAFNPSGPPQLNPCNFSIYKKNSILNGFFTRIGTTEVVLEWSYPNINPTLGNNTFTVQVGATNYTVNIPQGIYTIGDVLDYIVDNLGTQGTGLTWSVYEQAAGIAYLNATGAWTLVATTLSNQLRMTAGAAVANPYQAGDFFKIQPAGADLRPVRYLDFVSSQLTYNQDLKDDSTNSTTRDVLCRWYFAFDQWPGSDQYGYPVLMGYEAFVLRRIFSPPKQVKWDPRQPVGQLSFQVYPDNAALANPQDGTLIPPSAAVGSFEYLMTLQVSEN